MSQASQPKLFLYDHPVSSYAQKVRIALREKGVPFTKELPAGIGSGQHNESFFAANPRQEVPALIVNDSLKIFDSTVILEYIEDAFPSPALLPKDPAARAEARMIEDVCDTQYEAVNWGYGEITWFDRAQGDEAQKLIARAEAHTRELQAWLEERLGSKDYLVGDSFGWADVSAAPIVNRSVSYGFGPKEGSALQRWHARVSQQPSVKETFAEFDEAVGKMSQMRDAYKSGDRKREYRDHRLEWMIKAGGIDVVTAGLRDNNIRFSWPQ